MKICRIRKFKRKLEAEITLRVSAAESKQLSHIIDLVDGEKLAEGRPYPELKIAGAKLLRQLNHEAFSFWITWENNYQ